ncbi:hypothetical protein ALC53_07549 [Atta colombica]|uniref:Uncharacterized protein n=1 Tax=Atta colombica TaxID=520822 RepID=A0A195BCT2_9HYME|nr:hypothetical protein ALC53_07549 [Atta colombica]
MRELCGRLMSTYRKMPVILWCMWDAYVTFYSIWCELRGSLSSVKFHKMKSCGILRFNITYEDSPVCSLRRLIPGY